LPKLAPARQRQYLPLNWLEPGSLPGLREYSWDKGTFPHRNWCPFKSTYIDKTIKPLNLITTFFVNLVLQTSHYFFRHIIDKYTLYASFERTYYRQNHSHVIKSDK
jgi:hypothetical protein